MPSQISNGTSYSYEGKSKGEKSAEQERKTKFFLAFVNPNTGKPDWRMIKKKCTDPSSGNFYCPYADCSRSAATNNAAPLDWKKTYDHVRYHFRSLGYAELLAGKQDLPDSMPVSRKRKREPASPKKGKNSTKGGHGYVNVVAGDYPPNHTPTHKNNNNMHQTHHHNSVQKAQPQFYGVAINGNVTFQNHPAPTNNNSNNSSNSNYNSRSSALLDGEMEEIVHVDVVPQGPQMTAPERLHNTLGGQEMERPRKLQRTISEFSFLEGSDDGESSDTLHLDDGLFSFDGVVDGTHDGTEMDDDTYFHQLSNGRSSSHSHSHSHNNSTAQDHESNQISRHNITHVQRKHTMMREGNGSNGNGNGNGNGLRLEMPQPQHAQKVLNIDVLHCATTTPNSPSSASSPSYHQASSSLLTLDPTTGLEQQPSSSSQGKQEEGMGSPYVLDEIPLLRDLEEATTPPLSSPSHSISGTPQLSDALALMQQRIELSVLRQQLEERLGGHATAYYDGVRRFVHFQIAKHELDRQAHSLLGGRDLHLHDGFLEAISKGAALEIPSC